MNDSSPPPASRSRFRPQFSLRFSLLAMTLVALGIGYWAARQQAMKRIARRHNDVVQCLADNTASLPQGASSSQPSAVARMQDVFGSQIGEPLKRRSGSRPKFVLPLSDQIVTTARSELSLNVQQMPTPAGGASVADAILSHYEAGFAALGMNKSVALRGDREAAALWTAAGNQLVVEIEVRLVGVEARIKFLFLDSQRAELW